VEEQAAIDKAADSAAASLRAVAPRARDDSDMGENSFTQPWMPQG
jgi:hypothetical protein